MNSHKIKAFTLIELIIVITILAILATIGFMSYQSYTADARDSSRITSLKTVYDWLTISYVKKQIYPTPDDYIDIVWVSKQWYVWDTVIKSIRWDSFKDPKDNTRFLYSLDYTWKKIELSGFLENNNKLLFSRNNPFVNQAFAWNIDYTSRYIYTIWDKVGILLDSTTNSPVNERISTWSIDLSTNTGIYTAVFSNNSTNSWTISGSWQSLLTNISIIQNSCVLWNTVVTNWWQISAYNTTSVAYNQTCTAISRTCNNWLLSWDISYKYDTCTVNNTQTYTCTWLPSNAIWNTVSSYIQTWNWSSWLPANTTATYNLTASTSSCNYICNTWYSWDWSNCIPTYIASTVSNAVGSVVDYTNIITTTIDASYAASSYVWWRLTPASNGWYGLRWWNFYNSIVAGTQCVFWSWISQSCPVNSRWWYYSCNDWTLPWLICKIHHYDCPNGWTISGSTCVKSTSSTSCPVWYTDNGSNCKKTVNYTYYNYLCSVWYTAINSGGNTWKTDPNLTVDNTSTLITDLNSSVPPINNCRFN